MGSYKILWKKSAEHDIRNIDKKYIPKIISVIESLPKNPFPKGASKIKISTSNYRIRVGKYRVIYQVDTKDKLITIYHIRHRKDAYR